MSTRADYRTSSVQGAAAFDRDHTVDAPDRPDLSDLAPVDLMRFPVPPATFCVGEDPWAAGPDACMCGLPGCPSLRNDQETNR